MRRRPGLPRVKSGRLGVLEGAASRASFESLPPVGAVGAGAPWRPRALPARRARALAARLPGRTAIQPSVCWEGGRKGSGKRSPAPCASLPGSSNCARLPAHQRLRTPPLPPAPPSPRSGAGPAGWVARRWARLCCRHRHDRRPAPARLQPEGGVRAPGALLPGSAGGAGEQAAPQHRRAALGPGAQQAPPPKGARGGRSGWTERD